MNNDDKKTHLEYIQTKGKFNPACNHVVFKPQELKLLEKYGHWFEALTNSTLLPFNTEQEQFIEAALMKRPPETDYERVWLKYLKRKEIEVKYGPVLNTKPTPNDDTFYSRDMVKNLKSTMFNIIRENHGRNF